MDAVGFTAEPQCGHMALDFCITRIKPVGHEVIFLWRPFGSANRKRCLPNVRGRGVQSLWRKCGRNVFPHGVPFVAMDPTFPLLQIHRV